jgi:hypothetical protein
MTAYDLIIVGSGADARFIASWIAPIFDAPSPNVQIDTRSLLSNWAAQANIGNRRRGTYYPGGYHDTFGRV